MKTRKETTGQIGTRELRAKLAACLHAGTPLVIGSTYQPRGFLIPIPKYERWNDAAKRAAVKTAIANAPRSSKTSAPDP